MVYWPTVLLSSGVVLGVRALPQGAITSSVTAPSITISTAVASPSVPLSSSLPSQVPLPPTQAWCPSKIFCAGEVSAVDVCGAGNGMKLTCPMSRYSAPSNCERRWLVRGP